jgi:hypothetical protein
MKARIGQGNNKLEESTVEIEKEFPIKIMYDTKRSSSKAMYSRKIIVILTAHREVP